MALGHDHAGADAADALAAGADFHVGREAFGVDHTPSPVGGATPGSAVR